MDEAIKAGLALVAGIITLAIISVLISKNAQTPAVIGAATGGIASLITAAVAPVTGGPTSGVSGTGGIFGNLGASSFASQQLGGLLT